MKTPPLTSGLIFIGQSRNLFQLAQDSNTQTMRLTIPHFMIKAPMGAQRGTNAFTIYTTWVQDRKMTTVQVGSKQSVILGATLRQV